MRLLALFLAFLLAPLPARAADALRVVTTLPDLADWVRQIGGERVEVRSLLTGFEDVHTYEPRVSDVKAVAGARVLVMVGLGLEEWIHGLVENAGNGGLIVVEASKGVSVLRDPEGTGRAGHDSASGNPHVWLDPANVAVICRNIARSLKAADPTAGDFYQRRLSAYLARLDALASQLRAQVARLKDRRFLAYHPAWPYFARGFGFQLAGVVTESPGQEPSAKGIAALIDRIRRERLRVLVTEPQLSSKLPSLLAQETGIQIVTLSDLLGQGPGKTYLEHTEANVRALLSALREAGP
ncbi:MAG: zinc ABC transporter substrate-binding protein [Deltaproteobacteria bacterium]|nr:zinc ABC transporter substrate-binding protein [Deltaproteobacteria bacterium]